MRRALKFWSFLVCATTPIACVALVCSHNSPVYATPSLQTALVAKYPRIRETQLDSCTTCHMPVAKGFLNEYGLALQEAKMNFEQIEDLDSDEDGRTNLEEIQDQGFPGSQATFPEYFIFHVPFSKEDPELGKVHFNHEMHVVKESFLSKGRCANCHGDDLFPKRYNDSESVRPLAHSVCWRCHETSGSKLAPKDCTGCHTGIDDLMEDFKDSLESRSPVAP
jgi:hypothetical protein